MNDSLWQEKQAVENGNEKSLPKYFSFVEISLKFQNKKDQKQRFKRNENTFKAKKSTNRKYMRTPFNSKSIFVLCR